MIQLSHLYMTLETILCQTLCKVSWIPKIEGSRDLALEDFSSDNGEQKCQQSLKTYDRIDKEGPLGRRMTLWKWPLYTNQDKIPDLVSFEYNDPRQELIVI